jgi:hypothetical protein
MKVTTTLVGIMDHHRELEWPEGWPIPREGESVTLPGEDNLSVRTVVWYPEGSDEDEEDREPFVYLVIGPHRPNFP